MLRIHILLLLLSITNFALSAKDSSFVKTEVKSPKHYISNCVYSNYYSNQERHLSISPKLDKQLGSYKYSEINTGFYLPFFTRDYVRKDSVTISNLHLLFVGNFLTAKPVFSALSEQHHLYKVSLGLRMIHNNGKKNIWFYNGTPVTARDQYSSPSTKYASILVFNRTVSQKFSYRLGLTKTFIFGNRVRLPIIGFRVGPLDGIYMSMMLPRNISLNFPMGKKFTGSFYIKPLGGLYDFSNRDSIYSANDDNIQFGRYEFLNGLRLDYNPNKNFSMFLSGGVTKYNAISFASVDFQTNKRGLIAPFYIQKNLSPSLFINWGVTLRFGKTKKVYNNMNMYDVFELNNTFDPGDNNDGPSNGNIPKKGDMKDIKKIQYKDVQDLIQLEDLY